MFQPIKLLLVDDDDIDRQAVRRALRHAAVDLEIHERTDRESAIAALETTPFDCILLDYHLPGATGLETLHAVRAAGHNVPVITLTGYGDEELAVELMKAGAADYLTKNAVTPERLERSLRYALALHRAERERNLLLRREQQARHEAQEANRAKDEFLATLSHELRTPLNAILGWVTLLASGTLDPAATRRAIEIIERNTRLQAQLIEDLLDISRIISGKLRLDVREVPIRTVLDGALDSRPPHGGGETDRAHLRRGSGRRDARLRPRASSAGRLEPALERDQVHARGRAGRRDGPARAGRSGDHGLGQRRRHQPGLPAVRVRSLPSAGRGDDAAARRPGARPGDRPPPDRAARRQGGSAERGRRPRRHLHGHHAGHASARRGIRGRRR
jgi:signal transduction histidine kinase